MITIKTFENGQIPEASNRNSKLVTSTTTTTNNNNNNNNNNIVNNNTVKKKNKNNNNVKVNNQNINKSRIVTSTSKDANNSASNNLLRKTNSTNTMQANSTNSETTLVDTNYNVPKNNTFLTPSTPRESVSDKTKNIASKDEKSTSKNNSIVIGMGSVGAVVLIGVFVLLFLKKRKRSNKRDIPYAKSEKSEKSDYQYQIGSEFLKNNSSLNIPLTGSMYDDNTSMTSEVISESGFFKNNKDIMVNENYRNNVNDTVKQKDISKIDNDFKNSNNNVNNNIINNNNINNINNTNRNYNDNKNNNNGNVRENSNSSISSKELLGKKNESKDFKNYCIDMKIETPTLDIAFPKPIHTPSLSQSFNNMNNGSNNNYRSSSPYKSPSQSYNKLSNDNNESNRTSNLYKSPSQSYNKINNSDNSDNGNYIHKSPSQSYNKINNSDNGNYVYKSPSQSYNKINNSDIGSYRSSSPYKSPSQSYNKINNSDIGSYRSSSPYKSPSQSYNKINNGNNDSYRSSSPYRNINNDEDLLEIAQPRYVTKHIINRPEQIVVTEQVTPYAGEVSTAKEQEKREFEDNSNISFRKPKPITKVSSSSSLSLNGYEKSSSIVDGVVKQSPQINITPKSILKKSSSLKVGYVPRNSSVMKSTIGHSVSTLNRNNKNGNSNVSSSNASSPSYSGISNSITQQIEDDEVASLHSIGRHNTVNTINSVATTVSSINGMRVPPVLTAFHHALPTPPTPKSIKLIGSDGEMISSQVNNDELMVPDILMDAINRDVYGNQDVRNISSSYCTIRRKNKNLRRNNNVNYTEVAMKKPADESYLAHRRNRSQDYILGNELEYYNTVKPSSIRQEISNPKNTNNENYHVKTTYNKNNNYNNDDNNRDGNVSIVKPKRDSLIKHSRTLPRHFGSSKMINNNKDDDDNVNSIKKSVLYYVYHGIITGRKKETSSRK